MVSHEIGKHTGMSRKNSLHSIFLSRRIDHLPSNFRPPLSHTNGNVKVKEVDNDDNEGVVCIERNEEISNGDAEINQHGNYLESHLLQEGIDRTAFTQSGEDLSCLLAQMKIKTESVNMFKCCCRQFHI